MYIAVSLTSESGDDYCVLVQADRPFEFVEGVVKAIGDEVEYCYIKDHDAIIEEFDRSPPSEFINELREYIENKRYGEEAE